MNWQEQNNRLEKEFVLKSFSEIIEKLNRVSKIADTINHHPDFSVYAYRRIRFSLCTHSAGNTITEKDRALALEIDRIFES